VKRSATQFVTAKDGTPIAYWSVGSGPPIVLIHNFVISHAELEWEIPSCRSFYEALAEHHQVIRLDPRNTGLSGGEWPQEDEQHHQELLDQVVGDVESVVDALGHSEFDLVATMSMGAVGIRLATIGRVRRLVLCDPAVNIPEAEEFVRYLRAAEAMAAVDPTTTSHMISLLWTDGAPPEDRDPLTAIFAANSGSGTGWAGTLHWNGTPWLSEVSAATLILSTKEGIVTNVKQVRGAAASIPEASLIGVEGFMAPYWVDRDATLTALGDFLGWDSDDEQFESDFSVIVFTDIVASTEVVDRLGDEAARNAVRSVEDLVAETAEDHSGKVIKHLGDGSLLEFRSASNALDFARKVQTELAGGDVGLRVGMAAGEPIHEDGDVHGAVVVVASRIADAAGTGEAFVSDGVRQLVVGKRYDFDDQGEQAIKGFDDPIRVWRLNT
jgi:class 3 adenylate cyclase